MSNATLRLTPELAAELVQKMHDLIDVPPFELRARVGWTLVEVGLRLAAAPKPVIA